MVSSFSIRKVSCMMGLVSLSVRMNSLCCSVSRRYEGVFFEAFDSLRCLGVFLVTSVSFLCREDGSSLVFTVACLGFCSIGSEVFCLFGTSCSLLGEVGILCVLLKLGLDVVFCRFIWLALLPSLIFMSCSGFCCWVASPSRFDTFLLS